MGFDPATAAAVANFAAQIGSSILGRKKKERRSPIEKRQKQLIDQILGSLTGEGPLSDLFQADDAAFQRSVVDPSMQRFRDRIAPQIQQQFIASGQQRGTGLEDTLTRAGVDLQSNIDQLFLPFMQGAQNRKLGAIGNILGQPAGRTQPGVSAFEAGLGSGLGQLEQSDLTDFFGNIFSRLGMNQQDPLSGAGQLGATSRRGFSS